MDERSRRRLIRAGIAIWLALQIGVPLARKLELPSFRYRYTTYAWAMFSRPAEPLTVDLYRRDARGGREPIAGLDRFAWDLPAPGAGMRMPYRTTAEVEAWFTRLVQHIAERSATGWEYVVTLRWQGEHHDGPRERELSAPGRGT